MPTPHVAAAPEHGFTVRQLAVVLGTTPQRIRSFVHDGVLEPERGDRGEYRFHFRDVALLRSAVAMAERTSPLKVRRALKALRERLPEGQDLSSLRVDADGNDVVVREEDGRWDAESGQGILSFDEAPRPSNVTPIGAAVAFRRPAGHDGGRSVLEWYELGLELESCAREEAERAYRQVLRLEPDHVDATINLGRLRHQVGDTGGAAELYVRALEKRPNDPVALFNLGVVLEDLGEPRYAAAAYEQAAALDPSCADAHFNVARIYESLGDKAAAVRHLRRYRELTRA